MLQNRFVYAQLCDLSSLNILKHALKKDRIYLVDSIETLPPHHQSTPVLGIIDQDLPNNDVQLFFKTWQHHFSDNPIIQIISNNYSYWINHPRHDVLVHILYKPYSPGELIRLTHIAATGSSITP